MRRTKGVVGRQGVKGVGVREIEQLSHVIAPHLEATTTPLSSGNYIISRPRHHDLGVASGPRIFARVSDFLLPFILSVTPTLLSLRALIT